MQIHLAFWKFTQFIIVNFKLMNKWEILMKRQSSELMEQNPWNIVQFKVIVSIIIIV